MSEVERVARAMGSIIADPECKYGTYDVFIDWHIIGYCYQLAQAAIAAMPAPLESRKEDLGDGQWVDVEPALATYTQAYVDELRAQIERAAAAIESGNWRGEEG